MKKPIDLRAHLAQCVPDLRRHPDKLQLFVEKGRVATKVGSSLSYQYHYELKILITDFAESPDVVVVPILVWIQTHQPELLLDPVRRDKALAFEAEVIDHDKIDIEFTLDLSERVLVAAVPAGYTCEHIGEPQLPDLTGPLNWDIYLKGELLATVPE